MPAAAAVLLMMGSAVFGDTNNWTERIRADLESMNFEFARGESDLPFLPVASAWFKTYGETDLRSVDGLSLEPSFRTRTAGAYTVLPIHIGDKGFSMAIPIVGHTTFTPGNDLFGEQDVTVLRLAVGGAFQTSRDTQWGGFVMPSFYSPLNEGDWTGSAMGAVAGRRLVGERTVWYYGIFYDHGFSEGYYLPYLGLTYIFNESWSLALLAPWPALSYAPSDRLFFRLGANPSGASWSVRENGPSTDVISSIGGVDVGVWAGWKLSRTLWLAAGAGYSGLRSFGVYGDGDSDWRMDLDDKPWVSVSLSIRPE